MAVFKCKMCGGDLNIEENSHVAECIYCFSKQTIPQADSEKKMNLFNRANRLRMNSEFDKAASLYENIIAEFPEEAEAYWGLCLCNYGIEYVDDPVTAKKIPTCHRASFEKLADDENFRLALEYADISAQKIYRDEAREIDRIMGEILAISKNEKPYDVFICYKETDDKNERTADSVLAQDIYDALTARGMKVFFSRITLEEKLGMQYEPYIFAALNSAKVMLSIGTQYEYFNAVWVKNEWSRFLKLMAKDKSKVLIPCFKGIDAYDMPDEFKGLQAQDMGKLGAIQDIVRGVEKIAGEGKSANKTQSDNADRNLSAENIAIERGFLYLEDENFKKADEFFEKALNINPHNAKAYFGKLMVEMRITKKEQIVSSSKTLNSYVNFDKALRFADDEFRAFLKKCENQVLLSICEDLYNNAINIASKPDAGKNEIAKAMQMFESIKGYKDAEQKIKICLRKTELLTERDAVFAVINENQKKMDSLIKKPYYYSSKIFSFLRRHRAIRIILSIITVLTIVVFFPGKGGFPALMERVFEVLFSSQSYLTDRLLACAGLLLPFLLIFSVIEVIVRIVCAPAVKAKNESAYNREKVVFLDEIEKCKKEIALIDNEYISLRLK